MIEKIEIQNYKSIQHLELELRGLNVLIGSNGVGKSNFILFFEMVNAMYNQRLGSYTIEKGGIDNLLYFGRKNSDAINGLIDFDNTNAFFFTIKPTQANKGFIEIAGDLFNNGTHYDKNYDAWHQKIWDRAVDESELKNQTGFRAKYLKNYLQSFIIYHFHDTSKTSPMKKFCNVSDNQYLREDGSNLAAYLYYLSQQHPLSFKKIEGVIRSIAPFFDRFDLTPDRINKNQIQLEWKEKGSDMYLNGYSFSDGTLRFIALATLLLQPEPPVTIIIDEPELGLHPFAINKLAAMLKSVSKKHQVIVSTQSQGLVNNFDAEDVVVVDRKDRTSTFTRLASDDLTAWLNDYSIGDLWEKNLIGGQP